MRLTIIHRIYKSEAESQMVAWGSDVVERERCPSAQELDNVSTETALPPHTDKSADSSAPRRVKPTQHTATSLKNKVNHRILWSSLKEFENMLKNGFVSLQTKC